MKDYVRVIQRRKRELLTDKGAALADEAMFAWDVPVEAYDEIVRQAECIAAKTALALLEGILATPTVGAIHQVMHTMRRKTYDLGCED